MAAPAANDQHDKELVEALLDGDEGAFAQIIDAWSPGMLRLARYYVGSDASAEDVVQEAWLGALKGLANFEGRSHLRTWVLQIVANIAKTTGQRERRASPFPPGPLTAEPTVAPERFRGGEASAGAWRAPPAAWPSLPEETVLGTEAYQVVCQALDDLPPPQRAVIELRDFHGYDAAEVCDALGLSPGNQRVLLHRARANVRTRVEFYFGQGGQRPSAEDQR